MRFEYSFAFRNQLYDRFYYFTKHIGQVASLQLLEGFIAGFEQRVKDHPGSTPLCAEAADIGLTTYHDYVDPKLQLRAIYRFSEAEAVVYPLLFLSTKQSIRQALIQHCLCQE